MIKGTLFITLHGYDEVSILKHRVKIKGRLRLYFQASLLMGIFLALIDFYILNLDVKAGVILSI